MTATVGRIVHYKLSEWDAKAINSRRNDAYAFRSRMNSHVLESGDQLEPGDWGRTGHVEHTGNAVAEGIVYPAMVVATWGGTTVNLQVILDGNDTYWATSRQEGTEPGYWAWPERV